MDDKTTLEDLLKLELHKYEEEVKNIVDKAVKEMSMEKVLKELHNTWDTLEFDKELHERTKLYVLKISEETIETLEDHQVCTVEISHLILRILRKTNIDERLLLQVQLQNMLASKYVAFFLDEVMDWQRKLNNADATISAWFDVQRTWMHLESIFIGSEDIRSQLPEESKRFEKIDKDFKVIFDSFAQRTCVVFILYRSFLEKKKRSLFLLSNSPLKFSVTGSVEGNVEQFEYSQIDE